LEPLNISSYKKPIKTLFFNDFLSLKELKKIFEFINNNYANEIDRAMLQILIRTGIRVSELLNIQKKDITTDDPNFYTINIKGKNKLYRIIYIKKRYIEKEFKILFQTSNEWIFEKNKKKVTPQDVYYLVNKTLKKTNIYKNKSGPHLFRHTFATHLYRRTKDIIMVQESLGHKSIQSTQIYIHSDLEYLKQMSCAFDD
jgi:integrase/recombinase XerD